LVVVDRPIIARAVTIAIAKAAIIAIAKAAIIAVTRPVLPIIKRIHSQMDCFDKCQLSSVSYFVSVANRVASAEKRSGPIIPCKDASAAFAAAASLPE
jgi:hypothetical protein